VDFCGLKSFKFALNDTVTDLLTGTQNNIIQFSPLADSVPGTAIGELTVSMDFDPSITSVSQFDVITLGYIPPVIED
jgi:hypothetical protein